MWTAGRANHALKGDGGARGSILLIGAVALESVSRIVMGEGWGGGWCDVEEEVDANGKIRRIDEPDVMRLHQFANAVEFVIPSGCTDDHVPSRSDAGFNVASNTVGCSEIDHDLNVVKLAGSEGGAVFVFGGADDGDVMLAFVRYLRHLRSCLAAAENQESHGRFETFNRKGRKECRKVRQGMSSRSSRYSCALCG